MIPILIISSEKKQIEKFIMMLAKNSNINTSHIIRIEGITQNTKKKSLSIDQIRDLNDFLSRTNKNNLLVAIYEFDTAKEETQNAFLKTLEEKSNDVLFCLVASNEMMVLPTIKSRTTMRKISMHDKRTDTNIFFHKHATLPKAINSTAGISKNNAISYLDEIILFLKTILLNDQNKKDAIPILKEALETRRYIILNNVSPEQSLDHIFIQLFKKGILPQS